MEGGKIAEGEEHQQENSTQRQMGRGMGLEECESNQYHATLIPGWPWYGSASEQL